MVFKSIQMPTYLYSVFVYFQWMVANVIVGVAFTKINRMLIVALFVFHGPRFKIKKAYYLLSFLYKYN
ncbi:MAG: hypothetical protein ACI90V_010650 [Bacillariaceae sp.]|jgi:hypothetical protein